MPWIRGTTGSGGGSEVVTGTMNPTSTNTEYTINTGKTSLTCFMFHAYSNKSYGYTLQLFNRWDSTDASNQFVLTRYGANGTVNKMALSSTSGATYMSIVSVSGGTVKIKSATNTNWVDLNLTWYAW